MPYNLNAQRDSSVDEILLSIKDIIEENTAKHYAGAIPSAINSNDKLDFSTDSMAEDAGVSVDEAMAVLAQQIGAPFSTEAKVEDITEMLASSATIQGATVENKEIINELFAQAIEEIRAQLRIIVAKWVQENLPGLIKELLHEEIARSLNNMK